MDGHRDGGRTELKIECTLDSNQNQVSMSHMVFTRVVEKCRIYI